MAEKKESKKTNLLELVKVFELATSVGFSIALPIAIGIITGFLIDKQAGTKPAFTLLLLFLGVLTSFYTFYKSLKSKLANKI